MMSPWLKDMIERTAATAAEAGIAYAAVRLGSINPAWAVPIASVLAIVKAKLATFVGDPESASLTKTG
jgi:hypothetical protein